MPIQQTRKISKLDLNPNMGIGVSLPFNSQKVFTTTYTTREQIKSNLINFILTNTSERIMNPEFGAGLRRLLFSQIDDVDTIKNILQDKINFNFPTIDLIEIDVLANPDTYTISIAITYEIKSSGNTTDTIQVNLNQ